MARATRSSLLESRTQRLKLPVARKPVFIRIGQGVALGYRRNAAGGTWSVRCADGAGGNWLKIIGAADDHEDASAGSTLTYWQAQERARALAHAGREGADDAGRPASVSEALDAYEIDLAARGGDIQNVARVRSHLTPTLAAKTVALLGAKELRAWRDGLLKSGLAPASVARSCRAFKAALNLAASHDPRITNASAWKEGLKGLPDAESSRNVIVAEPDVVGIVRAAYEIDQDFGLLVEVAAVTGARVSQIARLQVGDLQNGSAPRLMMPTSKKGRGQKRVDRYPVPVSQSLADKLKSNRPADEPLLLNHGASWLPGDHRRPFERAVALAKIEQQGVTLYALRHTSITRQLLAGVPIRIVAAGHDTSVMMLERTYSKHIGSHSDALVRGSLLDIR